MNAFWNSFRNSLEINKYGMDGRRQVLSIIANDFNYEVIKKNLDVSSLFELITTIPISTSLFKLTIFFRFRMI